MDLLRWYYTWAAWDVRRWDIYGCCFSLTKEADGNIRPETTGDI